MSEDPVYVAIMDSPTNVELSRVGQCYWAFGLNLYRDIKVISRAKSTCLPPPPMMRLGSLHHPTSLFVTPYLQCFEVCFSSGSTFYVVLRGAKHGERRTGYFLRIPVPIEKGQRLSLLHRRGIVGGLHVFCCI